MDSEYPQHPSLHDHANFREQQRLMVQRFIQDYQARLQRVQLSADEAQRSLEIQTSLTRRWRRRAWRCLLWALLALLPGGWWLVQSLPQATLPAPITAQLTQPPTQPSQQQLQALRGELAQQHWLAAHRALAEQQTLLASHHFLQAAIHEPTPHHGDNARLAAREMLAGLSLIQVQDLGQKVTEAQLLDSERLLIRGDQQLRLWHPQGSVPLGPPLTLDAPLLGMAVDYPRVIAWSQDRARVWDVQRQERLLDLDVTQLHGVAFLPSGFLSWGADGALCWWNSLGSSRQCRQHPGAVLGVSVETAHERLLSWSWSPQDDNQSLLTMHPLGGGEPLLAMTVPGRLSGAALNPAGNYLVGWGDDGRIRLWDATSGELLRLIETQQDWIHGGRFIGDQLLTWSEDGSARLWRPDPQGPLGRGLNHPAAVIGTLSGGYGHPLLTWSGDGAARLWDHLSGAPLSTPLIHNDIIHGAQFGPEGLLLTWSADASARLWDSHNGQPLAPRLHHPAPVVAAGFLGANQLYSIDRQGELRRWSRQSQLAPTHGEDPVLAGLPTLANELGQLSLGPAMPELPVGIAHAPWMRQARLNSGATRVLVWGGDLLGGQAGVWDLQDGTNPSGVLPHRDRVAGGLFHPDGQQFLTWTDDGQVQRWNLQGRPLGPPLETRERILGVRWNPIGTQLLTWHGDATVRLWDSHYQVPLMPPQRVFGGVRRAFFADSHRIVIEPLLGPRQGLALTPVPKLPKALASAWLEVASGTGLGEQQSLRVLDSGDWAARYRALPVDPAQLAGVDHEVNSASNKE